MHLKLSTAYSFLYSLKKIIFKLFGIDKSFRYAAILGLLLVFFIMLFGPVFAQSVNTPTQAIPCSTGWAAVPLNLVTQSFIGTTGCENVKTAIDANGYTVNYWYPSGLSSANSTSPTGDITNDPSFRQYYRNGGAVGALAYIGGATMDWRPATIHDAVTYEAHESGLTINAQVTGFTQLEPIATLWGVFRNISLLLFVVVFIAIGFFILIQRKIGGQETVSLVSSVTNAAVAMVVIAFSYPIAGLIMDVFVNVMNGVVATTFSGFINSRDILAQLNQPNSGVNILTLMNNLSNIGVSNSAANLFGSALAGLNYPAQQVKNVFSTTNFGATIPVVGAPIGAAVGFFASAFVDILMGIISSAFNNNALLNAIIAFIIFIVMIRVVFALLGAYVSIIFKVLFAPFILLPAALPGNSGKAIIGWVMSLIANCLTFPAVFACILFAAMFLNLNANLDSSSSSKCNYVSQLNPGNTSTIQGNENKQSVKYFVVTRLPANSGDGSTSEQSSCYPLALPPKFNEWPAPLGYMVGVEPDDLIRFVLALAFIVVAPNIPKILQSALKIPQDNLMAGVSQGFSQGAGAFSGFISSVPSFGIGRAIGSITKDAASSMR